MTKNNFSPDPLEIMQEIEKISGFVAGFIHGSFVYNNVDFAHGYFREIASFQSGKLQESTFELKIIPPDVDIVVITAHETDFISEFNKIIEVKYDLIKNLNYFLTLNIVSKKIFEDELTNPNPVAIKRILAFRDLYIYGNKEFIKSSISTAKNNIHPLDIEFQNEYDKRKSFLKNKLDSGIKIFKLSKNDYKSEFPLYLDLIWNNPVAVFPKQRQKVVLPGPMNLKAKTDELTMSITELE